MMIAITIFITFMVTSISLYTYYTKNPIAITSDSKNTDKDISSKRLQICSQCPLYKKTIVGPICNNKLWYNVRTNEVSDKQKLGFKKGCGCRLNAKTSLPNASCPLGKW